MAKTSRPRPPRKRCPLVLDVTEDSLIKKSEYCGHASSDYTIILDDGGKFGIKLPLEEPVEKSWVGVKVQRALTSMSGRQQKASFQVFFGKVLPRDDSGLLVSLFDGK